MNDLYLLWHYTTDDVFDRILLQKAILPDKTEPDNPTENPTVTFSSNQTWEPTRVRVGRTPSGQMILMNKELLEHFCGLVRIGVPPEIAPMNWHEMKDHVGLSRGAIKGIYDFALKVGGRTSEWFATFDSVPEEIWVCVQKFKDGQWVDMPVEEAAALSIVEATPIENF